MFFIVKLGVFVTLCVTVLWPSFMMAGDKKDGKEVNKSVYSTFEERKNKNVAEKDKPDHRLTGDAGSSSISKEKDENLLAVLLHMRKDQKETAKVLGELSKKVQVLEQESQQYYYEEEQAGLREMAELEMQVDSETLAKKAKDSVGDDKHKSVFTVSGERLLKVKNTGSKVNTDLAELIDQLFL